MNRVSPGLLCAIRQRHRAIGTTPAFRNARRAIWTSSPTSGGSPAVGPPPVHRIAELGVAHSGGADVADQPRDVRRVRGVRSPGSPRRRGTRSPAQSTPGPPRRDRRPDRGSGAGRAYLPSRPCPGWWSRWSCSRAAAARCLRRAASPRAGSARTRRGATPGSSDAGLRSHPSRCHTGRWSAPHRKVPTEMTAPSWTGAT